MKIIDPNTNEPFDLSEDDLKKDIAKAYTASVRKPNSDISVASGLTPAKLASVLKSVASGDNPEDYFILAEEMEERELHYRSVLSTRKLAVAALPIVVEAASDDKKDLEFAEEIRQLFKDPQIPEVSFDLLDGLGKGLSVVQILWDTKKSPWTPFKFKWVDTRFLKPDKETLSEILLLSDDNPDGEPLTPYKYIIHTPRTKSGAIWRNGLARIVAVMYMLKSFTVRDWWAFAEVFGIPIRIGKYGPNASEDDIKTLVSAIRNIASDAGAVIPQSMEMELIESSKGNGGPTLFQNMAEWCDKQISKAVLGQTMTSEDGSSRAQASVHNEVRMDIVKWDARQLSATYNEYLVKPYIILNHGEQESYPQVVIHVEEPEDLKAFVEALMPLIDRGLQVEKSVMSDRFGLPEAEKGSDVLMPESAMISQSTLGELKTPQAPSLNRTLSINRLSSNINSDEELQKMEDEAMADWVETAEAFTNPVLDLANSVGSYEAFLSALPKLQQSLGAETFVEQMAIYMFQARGLGDVTDG